MKYTIDEEVCERKGVSLSELLAMLLVKTEEDLPILLDSMCKKQMLVKDGCSYFITQGWDDVASTILLDSDDSIPPIDRITLLADRLREIFPKGKKEGTNTYWRGNKKDVELKLKKFFKIYGNKYTDEQIIDATERYVSSFNGQYGYMRVLIYFIWKSVRKIDSEGIGYVEEVSDLATFIENGGQDDTTRENWTSTLK